MADTPTIDWAGKSGKTYRYWIHPISTSFKAVAGNYIFAKETQPGYWKPIYIGQTGDLSERFDNHHAMPCIKRNGATHIHAHTQSDKQTRLDEETDLVAKLNPSCNG